MRKRFPYQSLRAGICLSLSLLGLLALTACQSPEERAQAYYENGVKLLEQGDPLKASLEFRNALKVKEGYVPALYSLGLAQERMGHPEDAAKLFLAVTELAPDQVDARIRLATILVTYGQTDEALKFADQAYALAPTDPKVLAVKAAVALKLDNRGDANRLADAALEIDPKNIGALIVRAAERLKSGDPKGALSFLARSGEEGEGHIGVQLLRLKAFGALQDKEGVEKTLLALIKSHPESSGFRHSLVQFYIMAGRQDDAERALKQFAKDHPDDVQAELELVEFLRRVRNADAAESELESRIAKGGDVFRYKLAMAQLSLSKGNYSEAVDQMRKLIAETTDSGNSTVARLQLAHMLISKNENAEANKLVEAVLTGDEKNVEALTLRATIRMANGQLKDAIEDLRTAFNQAPQSAQIIALLADAYERNGSIALADEQYAKALVVEQFKPEVGLSYADFLLRYGKTEQAEKVLNQVANAAPKNRSVLALLAQVKLSRQDWVGAQKAADQLRALGESGDERTADQILSSALAGEKKYEESAKILEVTAADEPGAQGSNMAALVQIYLQAGKPDKAEEFLKSILASNPDNVQAQVLLGSVYLANKRFGEAEASYKAAIAKDPANPSGYLALGQLYLSNKQFQQAEDILREGLKRQTNNNVLRLQLAIALELSGQYDAAIAEYETMFAADPRSTIAANNLASLISEHQPASLDRAYEIANRFGDSDIPQFLDTFGWINYLKGKYDQALPLLKAAVEKLPSNQAQNPSAGVIQFHLAMTYKELGQADRAMAVLKKAIELLPQDSDQSTKARAALDQLSSAGKAQDGTKSN